jgi:uncharacterized protein YndB with AHSA1/START domain
MEKAAQPGKNSDITLVLSATFDASPEAVFDAWTDPEQLGKWIGPREVKAEAKLLEPRMGGRYRIAMHTPNGVPVVEGTYREFSRPNRLAFTWAWQDEKGGPGHEMMVMLTFKKVGDKTEMTLRQENFANAEARDHHNQGWNGSFEKLAEFLAKK